MRLLNRPLALILAAAVAAACVIAIIEIVAAQAKLSPVVVHWPSWYHWAHTTRWDRRVVQVWSAVLIVVGAILLAAELKPPRVARLRLRSADDATDAAVTRSGLAGALRAAALSVDGITDAAVTVRRRHARVEARSAARGRAATRTLRSPVTEAVRGCLQGLGLRHRPRLTVHVNPRRR